MFYPYSTVRNHVLSRSGHITSTIGLRTVFIRYNPKSYKPAKGCREVTSMEKRRDTLIKTMQYHMDELHVPQEEQQASIPPLPLMLRSTNVLWPKLRR